MQNPYIAPDYSKLTLTQLTDIYSRLDKNSNPQQAASLEAEIAVKTERLKKFPTIKNITEAFTDVRFAGFGIRFGAFLLDFFLFAIIAIIIGMIVLSLKIYSVVPAIIFVVIYNSIFQVFFTSKLGGSPGKLLCRVKVVNNKGKYIDYRTSILRVLPVTLITVVPLIALSSIIQTVSQDLNNNPQAFMKAYMQASIFSNILQYAWALDYSWFFFNKDSRTLHDLLASSYVMTEEGRLRFLNRVSELKEEKTAPVENNPIINKELNDFAGDGI